MPGRCAKIIANNVYFVNYELLFSFGASFITNTTYFV